jgi:cytochrome P450
MRAPPLPTSLDALFGEDAIADPHPLYARLRREAPIARVGDTGVHLVSTWALVEEGLGREDDFSANLTGVLFRGEDGVPGVFPLPNESASRVIATADEPDHAVHRAVTQPLLAPRRVAALEPRLRAWIDEALEPFCAAGGGDFVPIAETVPARAVAHLLGLPARDVEHFRRWSMLGGDILAGAIDPERLAVLGSETARMAAYLSSHMEAAKRRRVADDEAPLLRVLAQAAAAGRLTREHALGIAIILFGAGGESTAALLGSCVRILAERTELADALRDAPERIPRLVEEVVRLEPPFKFHYRVVRRATELGGCALAVGDRLMLVWASANRDAEVFEDPDALRLDRRHPKHHMGFGRGPHFCVGAPLARLEARLLIERLLARASRLAPSAAASLAYAKSIFVRRLERLPIDVA